MKSICVLTSLYPNSVNPASQVFVQQLVWALADRGVACTVICPVAVNLSPKLMSLPAHVVEKTEKGASVQVYFPKFISFGQRNFGKIKTARFTTAFFYAAIEAVWKKLSPRPEVIYGHFLTPAGISASRIAKKYGVASFAAFGESSPWSIYNYGEERIKKELIPLKGIVSVSSANKDALKALDIYPLANVKVFPNGVRTAHFYPRNKFEARKKFGFPANAFIVAFVGHFSERKGVMKLAEAVKDLDNVSVAFAGKGALQPEVANCIYKDVVKPTDMPAFLSAADVFVLPTLNEGCSNAIVEAMACGLPIISSDLPFNKDILNSRNAILIDPENISGIREAIKRLRDDAGLCESMGKASLETSKLLSLEARAANIYNWIKERTANGFIQKKIDKHTVLE